jgi:hypothetical protein
MDFEKRFWNKIVKTKTCWIWIASKRNGYGVTFKNKKITSSYRASYELHYGPIPKGMCVCHKCDVRLCVRPDHLFLGTVAENNRDKARKNRAARQPGELHGRHKLTQQQINEIRKTYKPGMIQRRMAEKYKVSYAQICRILNHTRWNSP